MAGILIPFIHIHIAFDGSKITYKDIAIDSIDFNKQGDIKLI